MLMKRLDDSADEHKVSTDKYHALDIKVTKLSGHVARAVREIGDFKDQVKELKDLVKAASNGEAQARTALWQKLGLLTVSLTALAAAALTYLQQAPK